MLLVSGATKTVSRIDHPRLGTLLRPGNGNMPNGRPWAADNGAYSGFDEPAFCRMLNKLEGLPGCLWVAAPDVVCDSDSTRALFEMWEPELHRRGFPVAFIAQNGQGLDAPWDRFECLFIGGDDAFKLGPDARALIREAKRRGKLVHVGRVNSRRRLAYCHELGADSVDGTKWTRFPDTWLRWGLRKIDEIEARSHAQLRFGGIA